jgi:hypothetical protein
MVNLGWAESLQRRGERSLVLADKQRGVGGKFERAGGQRGARGNPKCAYEKRKAGENGRTEAYGRIRAGEHPKWADGRGGATKKNTGWADDLRGVEGTFGWTGSRAEKIRGEVWMGGVQASRVGGSGRANMQRAAATSKTNDDGQSETVLTSVRQEGLEKDTQMSQPVDVAGGEMWQGILGAGPLSEALTAVQPAGFEGVLGGIDQMSHDLRTKTGEQFWTSFLGALQQSGELATGTAMIFY